MDLSVEEFIDGFFAEDAVNEPAHSTRPEAVKLPPWFDERKFNQGRRFFHDNRAALIAQMVFGGACFLSVPSIIKVVVGTKRSSSIYTAYKRYVATYVLLLSMMTCELKPGTVSWRSLELVRMRHFKVSSTTKFKNLGVVSQRDMALTVCAFFGCAVLHPEKFGIRATRPGDWDSFVYLWKVISNMLGIKDRYNVCRNTIEETRQVFSIINRRVFIPCLENVPEHFEHMARAAYEGIWTVSILSDTSAIWLAKWLVGVPGYIYFEQDKIAFRNQVTETLKLKGRPLDSPVETTELMDKCAVDGLPESPPRYIHLTDFATVDSVPSYNQLSWYEKCKVDLTILVFHLLTYRLFKVLLTMYVDYAVFMMKYFPLFAFLKFGKSAFGNVFNETPTDDVQPLPNKVFSEKEKYRNDIQTISDLKKAGLNI